MEEEVEKENTHDERAGKQSNQVAEPKWGTPLLGHLEYIPFVFGVAYPSWGRAAMTENSVSWSGVENGPYLLPGSHRLFGLYAEEWN